MGSGRIYGFSPWGGVLDFDPPPSCWGGLWLDLLFSPAEEEADLPIVGWKIIGFISSPTGEGKVCLLLGWGLLGYVFFSLHGI